MGKCTFGNWLVLFLVACLATSSFGALSADHSAKIPFFEGFESGKLQTYWAVDGTANYLTEISSGYGPAAGTNHLLMACVTSGTYSRNETTLTVDLSNHEHVVLSFDAIEYGDEQHGPPDYPFVDHADFDGVAVSADGTHWYEVASMRSLSGVYARQTVDLDAAVSAAGISYNSTFQIRFNHYDNYALTSDGIGIDNVAITGDLRDDLKIESTQSNVISGHTQGPFTPTNLVFSLTNTGSNTLSWSMSSSPWLLHAPGGGVLAAGSNDTVRVALDPAAKSWAAGSYPGSISFRNQASGFTQEVDIEVVVKERVLDHFEWAPIGTNQIIGVPFPVVVTAKDGGGQTYTSFTDSVSLNTRLDGQIDSPNLLGDAVHTQSGNYGTYTLGNAFTPNVPLTVTHVRHYFGSKVSIWTDAGELLASQEVVSTPGTWMETPLAEQVVLEAGTRYRVCAYSGGQTYYWSTGMSGTFAQGSLDQGYEVSADAFPTRPDNMRWWFVDLGFQTGADVTVAPSNTESFVDGVWTGSVAVLNAVSNMTLRADDGADHVGDSQPFDVHPLMLSVALPEAITEGGPALSAQVFANYPSSSDLEIMLSADATNDVVLPRSVILPAGRTDVSFDLLAVDDHLLDGSVEVTITASSTHYYESGSSSLFVHDNEAAVLTLTLPETTYEGSEWLEGVVRIDPAPDRDFVVELFSSNTNELGSGTVVIPAGQTVVSFGLAVVDDELVDGVQTVRVEAKVGDWTGDARPVFVFDNEQAALAAPPIAKEIEEGAMPWPMYQGNKGHTGYVPISLVPDKSKTLWSKTVGNGRALNPITVAEGKVYASSYVYFDGGDHLFVLDALTGEQKWTKNFGSVFSVNPPSYAYGNVYIQTGNHGSDTYLHAYNAETGTLVFKSPHSAQWERYKAPTIEDGVVYINGGYYGGMYAFDAYSGSQLWFARLSQEDNWTPSVGPDYVYCAVGGRLNALNKATGELEFSIVDSTSRSNTVLHNGAGQAFAVNSGRLIAYDVKTQVLEWQNNDAFKGQPAYRDGVVYALNGNGVSAVSAATSQILWSWIPAADTLSQNIIVTDSHLIVASASTTYMVDLNTRQSDWSYAKGGALALAEAVLYITSVDNELTAVSVLPRLAIELVDEATEGDGTLHMAGSVLIEEALPHDLVIDLFSSDAMQVSHTASVTIHAGQTSAVFDLQVMDNDLVDGSQLVSIGARSAGYADATGSLWVHDNESPSLSLVLPQSTVEGSGHISGMVNVSPAADRDIVVDLASDNPEKISGGSVVIKAGETGAAFTLTVGNDDLIDGLQTAIIEARVENWERARASVFIADNESTDLRLELPILTMEGDGVATNAGEILLSGTRMTDTHILLRSMDETEVTVPSFVTIPAGQTNAFFSITAMDDDVVDGKQYPTIMASAPGFVPATEVMSVSDNEFHHFTIVGFSGEDPGYLPVPCSVHAVNIDDEHVTTYSGPAWLSGQLGSDPVSVEPSEAITLTQGLWQGPVTFHGVGDNARIFTDDGQGHTGTNAVSLGQFNIAKMEADWELPYVYMIHRYEASPNRSILIWYNTESGSIEHAVSAGENATDLTVSYAENRIYVSNHGREETRVFDRSSKQELEPLMLGTDVYRVNAGRAGRIYTSKRNWIAYNYAFDTADGTQLARAGSVYPGDGECTLDGRYLYYSESYSSGDTIIKYDLSQDNLSVVKEQRIGGNGLIHVTVDGTKIFTNREVYDSDLNVVLNIGSNIHEISAYGDLAIGQTKAFNGATGEEVYTLPFASTVMALTGDQQELLLFNAADGSITSIATSVMMPLPSMALTPSPADGSVQGPNRSTLQWKGSPAVLGYDVYFGSDSNLVAAADTNSPVYLGRVIGGEIDLPDGALEGGNSYFWRIDSLGFGDQITTGAVWRFNTTAIYLDPPAIEVDAIEAAYTQHVALEVGALSTDAVWSASAADDWVSLSTAHGVGSDSLTIEIEVSRLSQGVHETTLSFLDRGLELLVPVTVRVETPRVVKMATDWKKPYVYAVHTAETAPNKSMLIWYNTDTARIEHVASAGENGSDLTIHYAEDRVYVNNVGRGMVRAFDRTSKTELDPLAMGSFARVNAGRSGVLITENSRDLRLFNTSAGEQLAYTSTGYNTGDGDASLDGAMYYHVDQGTSGSRLKSYDLSAYTFGAVSDVKPKSYYGSSRLLLSGDGQRVLTCKAVYRTSDLREIAYPEKEMYAASFYGRYAVTDAEVIEVDTGATALALPVSGQVAAFAGDHSKLVLFDATSGRFVAQDLAAIPDLVAPGMRPLWADGASIPFSQETLRWEREPFAVRYDVYLGADRTALEAAATSSPLYLGTSPDPAMALPNGGLKTGETYFWRVDAIGVDGLLKREIWSFTVSAVGFEPAAVELTMFNIASPSNATLSITCPGGTSWSVTRMPAWVRVDRQLGTGDAVLTLTVDKGALNAGLNEDRLTIASGTDVFDVPVRARLLNEVVKAFEVAENGKVYAASYETGHDESYLLEIGTEPFAVTRVLPLPEHICDLDIDPSGTNLYAIGFGDGSLAKVDLSSFEVVDMKQVPGTAKGTAAQHFNIAAGRDGIVYYLDAAWAPTAHVFDYDAGVDLSTQSNGGEGLGGLLYDDARRRVFSWRQFGWSAGNANSWVYAFDAAGQTLTKLQTSSQQRRDPLGSPLLLVDDGQSLINKKRRFNADDLAVVEASFAQDIYAATPNGRLAVGSTKVYRGTDGAELASLPYSTGLRIVTADGLSLVSYNASTKLIERTRLAELFNPLVTLTNTLPAHQSIVGFNLDELSWYRQDGALAYNVFFGTDSNAVANADVNAPEFLGTVDEAQIALGSLAKHMTYFWRVDAVDYGLVVTKGGVSSFKVASVATSVKSVERATLIADFMDAFEVDVSTYAGAATAWSVRTTVAWLACDTDQGSGPAKLAFSIDASQLGAGLHEANVEIEDDDGNTMLLPIRVTSSPLGITKMEADRANGKIYALNVATDAEKTSRLIVLDAATERIEHVIPVVDNALDFAVHYGDNTLYVSAFGNAQISAVDRGTFERLDDRVLNTGVYRISSGPAGTLVTDDDGSGNAYYGRIRVWDATTGTINYTSASYTTGRGTGESNADGSVYFRGDSTRYPYNGMLRKYAITGAGLSQVKAIDAAKSARRELMLSGDASRVFWIGKVYDADLALLADLGGEVYAANADGSWAALTDKVVNTATLATVATLPAPSTAMAFAADDTKLVYFNPTASTLGWMAFGPSSPSSLPEVYAEAMESLEYEAWSESHFPLGAPEAMGDSDADGFLNIDEFIAGTDPANAASYFIVHTLYGLPDGAMVISWDAVENRVYDVSFTPALTAPFESLRVGIGYPVNTYTDRVERVESEGFYRVKVRLAE